jgi:hypothetical protein
MTRLPMLSRLALAVLALSFATTPQLWSQVTTADLLGSVTDISGARVPGAKVTVQQTETNATRTSIADENGNFSISLLPVGHYTVRVENAGFKIWTSTANLAIGDRLRLEIKLELGQLTETVEVSAQGAVLQTDTATVGSSITEKAVQDLPLNGRNFINLV